MKKTAIIIALALLAGCARKADPVADINTGIQESAQQLIDYANNNMELDADKQLLIQGVKDCAARADALNTAHQASIQACESDTNRVKAERNSLALVLLLLLVAIKLFNIRL